MFCSVVLLKISIHHFRQVHLFDSNSDFEIFFYVLQEFFLTVKSLSRNICPSTTRKTFSKWGTLEQELSKKFSQTKEKVHIALCGKFITGLFINLLQFFTLQNIFLKVNVVIVY